MLHAVDFDGEWIYNVYCINIHSFTQCTACVITILQKNKYYKSLSNRNITVHVEVKCQFFLQFFKPPMLGCAV